MTGAPDTNGSTALAPRAAIALLTLQVRAAMNEAIETEHATTRVDADAALTDLRARVQPLVDARRRAHEEELAAARADSDAAISTARREAAAIIAAKRAPDTAPPAIEVFDDPLTEEDAPGDDAPGEDAREAPPAPPTRPAVPSGWPAPDAPAGPTTDDGTTDDGTTLMPVIVPLTDDAPPPGLSLGEVAGTATTTDGSQVLVVLDAESFARAFAAALGPVLERSPELGTYLPPGYVPGSGRPAKKGFWSHAWHPDVLLSGLAMVIVIIVLVAWTG